MTRRSQNVEREAKNVDLLLHEALSMKLVQILENGFDRHGRSRYAQIMRDIRNYHSSPEDAASVAAAASVRHLVLHHIVPPLPLEALKPEFVGNATTIFQDRSMWPVMVIGTPCPPAAMPSSCRTDPKYRLT